MEQAIVSGVSYTLEDAKVTLHRVPDRPGVAARVFTQLASDGLNVDMIIQNVSEAGTTDISFTVSEEDLNKAGQTLDRLQQELGFGEYETDIETAKISLVGAGMRSHPGVAARMFEVLAENGINIEMISTSSIKISCVIRKDRMQDAVRALHQAFRLDQESVQVEEIFGV